MTGATWTERSAGDIRKRGMTINLREALKEAEDLGCQVAHVRRTGEIRIHAPDRPKSVKLNSRRKDCPKSLETVVQQLRKKVRQLMRKDAHCKNTSARFNGNDVGAPSNTARNGTSRTSIVLLPEGDRNPEQDLPRGPVQAGDQVGHPACPTVEPAVTELSPEERKRLQHKLDGVILEIRRLEAFYAKERHFRFKIPKRCEPSRQEEAEAKDESRLLRMEETAKKIGELCCKREVLRVNLRR